MTAHCLGRAGRIEGLPAFVGYRHAPEGRRTRERERDDVSTGTKDALFLAASLIFMAGFFYFVVVGVRHRERAISRLAALAFLASLVMAGVFLVRLLF